MPSFLSKIAACRTLRAANGALLLFFCIAIPAHAQSSRSLAAKHAFHRAEILRRHLLAQPENARTRADYESVLNAYRAVYHGDPAAAEAPDSIVAVAELLQTEGRQYNSTKDFRDAIGQYDFLRRQYPASPLRYRALLSTAAIQRDDLHDEHAARQLDREFLRLYPHHDLAAQARADLDPPAAARRSLAVASAMSTQPARISPREEKKSVEPLPRTPLAPQTLDTGLDIPANPPATPAVPVTLQSIRYWSTAGYTRVAIDLSHAVTYQVSRSSPSSQTSALPDRIVFHLADTHPTAAVLHSTVVRDDPFLRVIRVHSRPDGQTQVSLDLNKSTDYAAFLLPDPDRLIIDLHEDMHEHPASPLAVASVQKSVVPKEAPAPHNAQRHAAQPSFDAMEPMRDPEERSALPPPATSPMRPTSVVPHILVLDDAADTSLSAANGSAIPEAVFKTRTRTHAMEIPVDTASQATQASVLSKSGMPAMDAISQDENDGSENSMTRVLGLKVRRIVIDAGHGGHDSGTLGPHGLEEKNVVLDVALRLGKLLQDGLGSEVVYTRTDDTFVPLEQRTAIANAAHADLFLSIHANSSPDADARGVETYFLNFTGSPSSLAVAERENATSNRSVFELSDLVRKIALSDKIDESRTFALDVQQSLYDGLEQGNPGLHNRGVKQAPFVVLIGANMPSILAEISFLTNSRDAAELRQPAYRQRIAEALYSGVAEYVESMDGLRVAENSNKAGR
ncbi:MAG TPA: N-acetylmuramoyl-L-alanine amidase [Acidobacteriaceae bacterium]|jgi:N-acetylmuramoyl-L-alanine amidase|nr:N-acetylmuramoyl-L-alanine amidase [Acidobacteriaceae bacterium]